MSRRRIRPHVVATSMLQPLYVYVYTHTLTHTHTHTHTQTHTHTLTHTNRERKREKGLPCWIASEVRGGVAPLRSETQQHQKQHGKQQRIVCRFIVCRFSFFLLVCIHLSPVALALDGAGICKRKGACRGNHGQDRMQASVAHDCHCKDDASRHLADDHLCHSMRMCTKLQRITASSQNN